MAAKEYKIGVDIPGLQLLSDLGIPEPLDEFLPFAEQRNLSAGNLIGLGQPQVTWHWGFVTMETYSLLRAYCPLTSAPIAIRTNDGENAWADYTGIMVFPPKRQYSASRVLDFTILFRQLVLVP